MMDDDEIDWLGGTGLPHAQAGRPPRPGRRQAGAFRPRQQRADHHAVRQGDYSLYDKSV